MATDTLTMGDLYDYANNMVAQRMMMLEGVSNAQVYGSARAVCIQMDAMRSPARLDGARCGECGFHSQRLHSGRPDLRQLPSGTSSTRKDNFCARKITKT